MNSSKPSAYPSSTFRAFVSSETSGGLVLIAAAILALVIANSPAASAYFGVLKTYVGGLSVLHWINDALMAVFFLLVGLEIKREFLVGELATWPQRTLSGFAALGGMVAPALIYVAFNAGSPETLRGLAIPTATDIAFALGVLALLGSRVPATLKVFLTALAILDDLAAVTIIALFYTENLALGWLALAGVALVGLAALNRSGVRRLTPYIAVGVVLWFVMLKSGVHATLAGVALALTIPSRGPGEPEETHSPLHILEHGIQPWVAFLVVPIFGFANAGVSLAGMSLAALSNPATLGITAGLFFGKPTGIFLSTWAAVRLRLATAPENASWPQVFGVSLLCGIGFTMSLFIGLLAFPEQPALQDGVKVGVLLGSILSGVTGALILSLVPRRVLQPAVP